MNEYNIDKIARSYEKFSKSLRILRAGLAYGMILTLLIFFQAFFPSEYNRLLAMQIELYLSVVNLFLEVSTDNLYVEIMRKSPNINQYFLQNNSTIIVPVFFVVILYFWLFVLWSVLIL